MCAWREGVESVSGKTVCVERMCGVCGVRERVWGERVCGERESEYVWRKSGDCLCGVCGVRKRECGESVWKECV